MHIFIFQKDVDKKEKKEKKKGLVRGAVPPEGKSNSTTFKKSGNCLIVIANLLVWALGSGARGLQINTLMAYLVEIIWLQNSGIDRYIGSIDKVQNSTIPMVY